MSGGNPITGEIKGHNGATGGTMGLVDGVERHLLSRRTDS